MKKVLFMAAVLLSTVSAFAQHSVGSLNLKPMVGFNIANVTDVDDSDPRYGLVAGVEAEYTATDILSVTAGAIYSQQGFKKNKNTYKYDYINVPILLNVYVFDRIAVKFGVQPSFCVNNDLITKNGSVKVEKSLDTDNVNLDFALPIGLSYEFNNFQIDARYNWSLSKINTNSDPKNSVFMFTLGYKLDL